MSTPRHQERIGTIRTRLDWVAECEAQNHPLSAAGERGQLYADVLAIIARGPAGDGAATLEDAVELACAALGDVAG